MQHTPPPSESLFVPSIPAALRGAPIAGLLVMAGGIAMLVGSWLPWQVVIISDLWGGDIFVRDSYGRLALLLGVGAVIAGIGMLIKATPTRRLVARMIGLLAAAVGVYGLYAIQQFNAQPLPVFAVSTQVRHPSDGLYILGIGVLLVVVGSFLQRGASSGKWGR